MRKRKPRTGAAMVEAAIVLPLFLLLILGILEFGRAVMIHQITTNACREAARYAVTPGAQGETALTLCEDYLDGAGISETGRSIVILDSEDTEVDLSEIGSRETVTIRVELPFAENTWGISSWLIGTTLQTEVTMRRE
jgi:Flp pilus assembly protein TadG